MSEYFKKSQSCALFIVAGCIVETREQREKRIKGKKKKKTWSVAALCHRRRVSITLSVCFHTSYQARLINKKDEEAKRAGLPAGWTLLLLLLLLSIRSREQGAGNILLGAAAATGWRLLFALLLRDSQHWSLMREEKESCRLAGVYGLNNDGICPIFIIWYVNRYYLSSRLTPRGIRRSRINKPPPSNFM